MYPVKVSQCLISIYQQKLAEVNRNDKTRKFGCETRTASLEKTCMNI